MKTATEINDNWNGYNKSIAECHLSNYGVIFLDDYDCPIDNEYELEELYERYRRNK